MDNDNDAASTPRPPAENPKSYRLVYSDNAVSPEEKMAMLPKYAIRRHPVPVSKSLGELLLIDGSVIPCPVPPLHPAGVALRQSCRHQDRAPYNTSTEQKPTTQRPLLHSPPVSNHTASTRPTQTRNLIHITPCITEIEPNLFISNYAAAQCPDLLNKHQVTAVVTLKSSNARKRLRLDPGFTRLVAEDRHLWVEVNDNEKTEMLCFLDNVCDFIDRMSTAAPTTWNNKPNDGIFRPVARGVLIHCQAGISRSSTALAAYLMRKDRWSKSSVLEFLARVHTRTNPNRSFRNQLEVWEQCDYSIWSNNVLEYTKLAYASYLQKHRHTFIRTPKAVLDRIEAFVRAEVKWAPSRRFIRQRMKQELDITRVDATASASGSSKHKLDQLDEQTGSISKAVKMSKFTTPCGQLGTGWSWSSIPVVTYFFLF